MTIEQIFDFQIILDEVAEEIIKIEPIIYSKSNLLKNIVSEIKKQKQINKKNKYENNKKNARQYYF